MEDSLEFDITKYNQQKVHIQGTKYIYRFCNDSEEYTGKVFYININKSNQNKFDEKISILKNTNYPTILKVFGYSLIKEEDKSYPIIITEFMNRKSLDNLFYAASHSNMSKSFTDTKKYITTIGVAYAIRFMHSKDLIHKNLRPSKILFDQEYRPHVSYLDIILDPEEKQATDLIYLAPEIFDDPQNYSKSSDIYAYSMIIYQLLSGKPPFKNPHNIKNDIENQNYPDTSMFDDCLSSFFESCWYNDPQDRPTIDQIIELFTTEDMKEQFGEVDEDEISKYLLNIEASSK